MTTSTHGAPASTTSALPTSEPEPMSHRNVLIAMSGLLLGMFVAILSGTVVSTALPVIVSDLGGGQTAYTWVITASLLATTASTPLWGKFADLFNRKLLIQLSLTIFVLGSALAGFSQDPTTLSSFRVVQGLGAGGLTALVQIVMADIVSPRDRGKYMGLIGAVMAVGTVGGPLLGGVITDTAGWRWNFYIALPIAAVAIIVLQKTLHIPTAEKRKVTIDYLGTALLAGGVSLLLIWVTLAGHDFDWISITSGLMGGGAVLMLAALVFVEMRVSEPIIPMTMFRSRTFTLSVVASISVGVAMFGTSIFLAEFMQLARGATPTMSGVMTAPLVLGLMVASTVAGWLISKRGYWKSYMVAGSILMTIGMVLMGTASFEMPFWQLAIYMVILGAGVGMVMQNLVLIVQNDCDPREIGVASSGIAFFRGLGGAIGISALGAVLATRLQTMLTERQADMLAAIKASGDAGKAAAADMAGGNIPDMATLPAPMAEIVQSVYGTGIAELFWIAAPLALVAIVAIAFLPNKPLGQQTTTQKLAGSVPPKSAISAVAESGSGTGDVIPEGLIIYDVSLPDTEADAEAAPVAP